MILTIHDKVITSTPRFRLVQDDPHTWVLHISQVQPADGGLYMCQVNTVPLMSQVGSLKVNEPPYIVDAESSKSTVTVRPRDNVTLTCAARGVPDPTIEWQREDGGRIRAARGRLEHGHARRSRGEHGQEGLQSQYGRRRHHHHRQHGAHHAPIVVPGSTLTLIHVTPADMGAYLCIAKNGIAPTVSKRIQLDVEFKPMIWVPSQLVGGMVGGSVTLKCRTEAHPKPMTIWAMEEPEHRLIAQSTNSTKYSMQKISRDYETEMILTIHHLNASDFGKYKCICQNYIGKVVGSITLSEIPRPTTDTPQTPGRTRWLAPTELVTLDNGGWERGDGEDDDRVYIPDQERGRGQGETEREKKRYNAVSRYDWEQQEQRTAERGTGGSAALHLSTDAALLVTSALAALL